MTGGEFSIKTEVLKRRTSKRDKSESEREVKGWREERSRPEDEVKLTYMVTCCTSLILGLLVVEVGEGEGVDDVAGRPPSFVGVARKQVA